MAWAFVQKAKNGNTGTTVAVTLTGVTVGDFLIVGGAAGATSPTLSVSDGHNTYTNVNSSNSSGITVDLWSTKVTTGGTLTITMTANSSISLGIAAVEYSGLTDNSGANPGAADGFGAFGGTVGTAASITNGGTTAGANELLVAFLGVSSSNTTTITAGAGTDRENQSSSSLTAVGFDFYDVALGAAGSNENASWTLSPSSTWAAVSQAFLVAAGGALTPTPDDDGEQVLLDRRRPAAFRAAPDDAPSSVTAWTPSATPSPDGHLMQNLPARRKPSFRAAPTDEPALAVALALLTPTPDDDGEQVLLDRRRPPAFRMAPDDAPPPTAFQIPGPAPTGFPAVDVQTQPRTKRRFQAAPDDAPPLPPPPRIFNADAVGGWVDVPQGRGLHIPAFRVLAADGEPPAIQAEAPTIALDAPPAVVRFVHPAFHAAATEDGALPVRGVTIGFEDAATARLPHPAWRSFVTAGDAAPLLIDDSAARVAWIDPPTRWVRARPFRPAPADEPPPAQVITPAGLLDAPPAVVRVPRPAFRAGAADDATTLAALANPVQWLGGLETPAPVPAKPRAFRAAPVEEPAELPTTDARAFAPAIEQAPTRPIRPRPFVASWQEDAAPTARLASYLAGDVLVEAWGRDDTRPRKPATFRAAELPELNAVAAGLTTALIVDAEADRIGRGRVPFWRAEWIAQDPWTAVSVPGVGGGVGLVVRGPYYASAAVIYVAGAVVGDLGSE